MHRHSIIMKCLLTSAIWAAPQPGISHELSASGAGGNSHVLLLAIDHQALPLRDNLCLYLSKPALREEPVLKPERGDQNAPDQLAAHFYGTVIKDGDKYRMWYYGSRQDGGRWKVRG